MRHKSCCNYRKIENIVKCCLLFRRHVSLTLATSTINRIENYFLEIFKFFHNPLFRCCLLRGRVTSYARCVGTRLAGNITEFPPATDVEDSSSGAFAAWLPGKQETEIIFTHISVIQDNYIKLSALNFFTDFHVSLTNFTFN